MKRFAIGAAVFAWAASLAPAAGNDSWNQGVERFKTSKDWPGMVAYTTRWTQAKPQEATAWCLLGFAYGKLRQWQAMKPAYDRCVAISPHDDHVWSLAASSYFDAWKFGSAIGVLKEGVAKNPNSSWIWENLGFDYGDLADAQTMQHSKVGDSDGLTPNQNLDLARQALNKALALGSRNHIDMWRQLGQWEVDFGQAYAAMQEFFKILKELPRDQNALHGLAVANGYLMGQCITHDVRPSNDPKYVIVGPDKWTCSAEMQRASQQAAALTR
jgi:tetratricopeptide (TPR) repeat protein